jgi:hypothetical protein
LPFKCGDRGFDGPEFYAPFQKPFLKFNGEKFSTTVGLNALERERHFLDHGI